MRKNFFIATLVGICMIGLAACSKEENKPADQTPDQTASAQTVTEQPLAIPDNQPQENQLPPPQQTAAAGDTNAMPSAPNNPSATPGAPSASDTPTPPTDGTAPAPTMQNPSMPANNPSMPNGGTMMNPPSTTDSNNPPATSTTPTPGDSSSNENVTTPNVNDAVGNNDTPANS